MSGPCMCGDPYCSSCGNPGAAAWECFSIEAQERFDACVAEAGSVEEGFYVFLERNVDWISDSYLKSIGGAQLPARAVELRGAVEAAYLAGYTADGDDRRDMIDAKMSWESSELCAVLDTSLGSK